MEAKDNENNIEEIKNEKETTQWKPVQPQKEPKQGKSIITALKRIIIVGILVVIAVFVLDTSKYYKNDDITDKTNVIINNNNITAKLKQDIIIENDNIYMSMPDLRNFFDNYIYEEPSQNKIITTYDDNIAEIFFDGNHMNLNDSAQRVDAVAIERQIEKENVIYLPISEMENVYNIELKYVEETDIITIDSIRREQIVAKASKNLSVKDYARVLSRTVDKVNASEKLIIISKREDGWTKVRTENGKIGFVKQSDLEDEKKAREEIKIEPQIEGKISMFWDYYSEYVNAPDRSGEKYDGVNVVSPTFFYIDYQGNFKDKVGKEEIEYIEWAHNNGYKVWPMISNSEAQNTKSGQNSSNILKVTSKIMNSYELRKELIQNIINVCEEYDLDGINIDFEYMYEKDKELFSRFIIELEPRMEKIGAVLSVDVTAPDGSPNWSLCFDRNVIGKVADYIVFMGYDQYSSGTVGTTAGYNWVEKNIEKFIGQEEVKAEKIILGIPFYTKLWTETPDENEEDGIKVKSEAVIMKNIEKKLPDDVTKTWDENLKQYYVEYKSGESTKKMWIEDLESLKAKVSLVNKYNLAGISAWEKDQELDGTWEMIKETLEN